MTVYYEAITRVIEREGGDAFTDRADDRGGPTKFGVTIPALSDYLGRPASRDEIRDLTEADARAVYVDVFIRRPGFDVIADANLLGVVLDCAANHGAAGAKRIVQRALGVTADGVWGPKTLEAIRKARPTLLAIRVLTSRARTYAAIVRGNLHDADRDGIPDNVEMLGGWIDRAMDQVEEIAGDALT